MKSFLLHTCRVSCMDGLRLQAVGTSHVHFTKCFDYKAPSPTVRYLEICQKVVIRFCFDLSY